VSRITPEGGQDEIVRTVVQLAHSLSMSVVAEGLEDEYQVALLRSIGCEYGQGLLLLAPHGR
jgi:EAL domain-containing protein (putative c-di-GMP-specific phosphodiesterase class I)